MGGASDRSDQHCQIQSRLQVSVDSGRRVFQVHLGGPRQDQDWTRRDDFFREDFETKRRSRTAESDDGKEFYNTSKLWWNLKISIISLPVETPKPASWNDSIAPWKKDRIDILPSENTLTFLPVLQDLVLGYNRSYHRSIKMAPEKVTASNQEEAWNNLFSKRLNTKRLKPKFKLNDRVRLNKKFRTFTKGYLPG